LLILRHGKIQDLAGNTFYHFSVYCGGPHYSCDHEKMDLKIRSRSSVTDENRSSTVHLFRSAALCQKGATRKPSQATAGKECVTLYTGIPVMPPHVASLSVRLI
jgi:hypothetical protein